MEQTTPAIDYKDTREIDLDQVLLLYRANHWAAATKPDLLNQALQHSDTVISAWEGDRLVGLGNAISDGFLVVYYPHLLVLPTHRGRGIGREIISRLQTKYHGFHQQILVADSQAIGFYQKCGFERAGNTEPMWIYAGVDHAKADHL